MSYLACTLSAIVVESAAPSESNPTIPNRSMTAHDIESAGPQSLRQPIFARLEKIISRPLISSGARRSYHSERGRNRPRSVPTLDGLTPAPRRVAAEVALPQEPQTSAQSRFAFLKGPSLTTFGSAVSVGTSRGVTTSFGQTSSAEEGGRPGTGDLQVMSSVCTRPETPASWKTFGTEEAGKRSKA